MTETGFQEHLRSIPDARVLEIGTCRSQPENPTHHKSWAPNAQWVMADFQNGIDVDVVADAHRLTDTFPPDSFDAVIAIAVFEHIQRPWIAASEVAKVLKPGGVVFIGTHQTFPIHAYPNDYWRFTTEALRTLFEDAGLTVLRAEYNGRCHIVSFGSMEEIHRARFPAYLNVECVARKPLRS